MNPSIKIRPFQPADYATVGGLYRRSPGEDKQDFEPNSEEELRSFDAYFEPEDLVLQRFVAEDTTSGEIIGTAHYFHMPWIADRNRYWAAIRVDSKHRRVGVGGRLYAKVMADLDRIGASAVRMMTRETTPMHALALARRGYVEIMKSWDFELDISTHPPPVFANNETVRPVPLPEVIMRDPEWLGKLNRLYKLVMKDVPIPGVPSLDLPPSWLENHLLSWPSSLPDACFVIVENGDFLGLSIAHRDADDASKMNQLLTGVAPKMRGRGAGSVLKRASIQAARQLGFRRIWTGVESNNPRMLAINEAFGFVKTGGLILFEKSLLENDLMGGSERPGAT